MTEPSRSHYSYTVYADPAVAGSFDARRFGGPIGELVASTQAEVLVQFAGDVRGRRVLDVGTGTGRAALLMAANGAHVTGVDASEEMLVVARRRAGEQNASAEFLAGDAHHLEFPDRAFDVALSLRVLMHTPRWETALGELCRVTSRLVILDFPSVSSLAVVQSVGRRVLFAAGVRTEPYRVFSLSSMVRTLRANGFQVRAVHRLYVLPIALHKLINSKSFTVASERVLERSGLTRILGSPITVVAERCAAS